MNYNNINHTLKYKNKKISNYKYNVKDINIQKSN
jgi:hypothetical protein